MTKAQRYFMEIKDKRVAFIGTGVSHLELIKLFLSKGIRCVVCDKKTEDEFDELIYEELSAKGCEFSLGEHDACLASEFFNEWFEANGNFVLPHNKCVGYKVPLFLNGEDDIENLEVSDMEVYWEIMMPLMNL